MVNLNLLTSKIAQSLKEYQLFLKKLQNLELSNLNEIVESCLNQILTITNSSYSTKDVKLVEIYPNSEWYSANLIQKSYGFNIKIEDVDFAGIIAIELEVDEHSGCLVIHEIKLQTLLPTEILQEKVKDFISQNNILACFQIANINGLK